MREGSEKNILGREITGHVIWEAVWFLARAPKMLAESLLW